jgi:hypothetical protein
MVTTPGCNEPLDGWLVEASLNVRQHAWGGSGVGWDFEATIKQQAPTVAVFLRKFSDNLASLRDVGAICWGLR